MLIARSYNASKKELGNNKSIGILLSVCTLGLLPLTLSIKYSIALALNSRFFNNHKYLDLSKTEKPEGENHLEKDIFEEGEEEEDKTNSYNKYNNVIKSVVTASNLTLIIPIFGTIYWLYILCLQLTKQLDRTELKYTNIDEKNTEKSSYKIPVLVALTIISAGIVPCVIAIYNTFQIKQGKFENIVLFDVISYNLNAKQPEKRAEPLFTTMEYSDLMNELSDSDRNSNTQKLAQLQEKYAELMDGYDDEYEEEYGAVEALPPADDFSIEAEKDEFLEFINESEDHTESNERSPLLFRF